MPEWLLFALAVCASVGFWSFVLFCFNRKAKREWRELEKLRDERAGHSLETFQEHFAKRQVPPEVSAAVYQYLQAYASVPAFPVLPQDRLERLYGVADDETPALLD